MEKWILENESYLTASILNFVFMAALATGLFYGAAHLLGWIMEWIKKHKK